MIDRTLLIKRHRHQRRYIHGWLSEFLQTVPILLREARVALAREDPKALGDKIHEIKGTIIEAGGLGRLREAAVEALSMCGSSSTPRLPEDAKQFLRLLDDLEYHHNYITQDVIKLIGEFTDESEDAAR